MNEWEHEGNRGYGPPYSTPYPHGAPAGMPLKKKWIAGLLAFFIPGTGHLYLGQMFKGVAIMLLITFDICAIVFAAMNQFPVLIVVLLSLFLPIVYFYSLFDAIQSTDMINYRWRHYGWQGPMSTPQGGYPGMRLTDAAEPVYSEEASAGPIPQSQSYAGHATASGFADRDAAPPGQPQRGHWNLPRPMHTSGVLLLAAAVIALILIAGFGSSGWIFRSSGSAAGAVVLIAAGVGLWLWEWKADRSKRS